MPSKKPRVNAIINDPIDLALAEVERSEGRTRSAMTMMLLAEALLIRGNLAIADIEHRLPPEIQKAIEMRTHEEVCAIAKSYIKAVLKIAPMKLTPAQLHLLSLELEISQKILKEALSNGHTDHHHH